MKQGQKIIPYGLWKSPISPVKMARSISLTDIAIDDDGSLVWLENRAGRGVLVVQPCDGQARRDLNAEFSIRANVGYGGGDFSARGGNVYFVESKSGRIYIQPTNGGQTVALTPGFGSAASPTLSPDGAWLCYIHSYEDEDSLAIVDSKGVNWPLTLTSGEDFYMQPAWHPDSQQIAWISWNHPNMPWDGTRLHLGRLVTWEGSCAALKDIKIVAGDDETSISQPEFSADGRYLAYLSDASGWWQLYLYDLTKGEHRQITTAAADHGVPAWVQGVRTYAFNDDGKSIFFIRNQAGFDSLWKIDLDHGVELRLPLESGYTKLAQIRVCGNSRIGNRITLLASGGKIPPRVISTDEAGIVRVWARGTTEELDPHEYSNPEPVSWKGMDGEEVFGIFYSPNSSHHLGLGKPPLIVFVHGGPTSQANTAFDLRTQFFTTRGYAVLDVNYRGSTGYGRTYREKLAGNWGIYDVQDSVSGARHLDASGRVDGERMVIMGWSAGGFTVLMALEDYPGVFKAGVCLYGVSNQFTLATDTHKFEAHYSDKLLGMLPEAAPIYRQRSPIFHTEKIKDPLAIFQGEDDKVVPRDQADELVESLKHRGVSYIYHVYPGEGHGFRKSETIEHLYTKIERFLKQYVIFS